MATLFLCGQWGDIFWNSLSPPVAPSTLHYTASSHDEDWSVKN